MKTKRAPSISFEKDFDINDLKFKEQLINEIIQDLEDASFDFGRAAMVLETFNKAPPELQGKIKSKMRAKMISLYDRASKEYTDADTKLRNVIKMLMK